MAEIDSNQYDYLSNLAAGKGPTGGAVDAGTMGWAKAQLAANPYTPPAPNTTSAPTTNPAPTPAPSTGTPQTGTTGTTSALSGSAIPKTLNQVANNPTVPSTPNAANIQKQMDALGAQYNQTTDPVQMEQIHQQKLALAAQLGETFDPNTGTYSAPNQNYNYLSTQGTGVSSDATSHLIVNGQQKNDVQVAVGRSYDNAQTVADTLGLGPIKVNPNTGMVNIGGVEIKATGYDKNGAPIIRYNDVAQALGYRIDWNSGNNTITITKPQDQPQNTGNGTGISPYMNQLMGMMPQQPGISPYQSPDLSAWQNQLMPYQQFNGDMNQYYDQAHAQLDPQFNTQYNNLMSKQAGDLTHMDDSMNRRGIYTSGIAQAAENDLRAKTTDAVASVFNKQMSDIEKTAQQLYNNAFNQYQKGNQFALNNNKDVMSNMLAEQKQSFTQWLDTQKLDQSQYTSAVNAWDKMAGLVMHDVQFNQKMSFDQTKFNNLSADQSAVLNQNWQKAMLPYNNLTQQQQVTDNQNLFKMLGYVQMPDGSLRPTLQASTDQQNYALNLGKALGYITMPDGSMVPTEQAKRDSASAAAANDKNMLSLYQMMGFGPDGRPTLARDQLTNTINHDQALIDNARKDTTNKQNLTLIDGIGKQLTSVNTQISAAYNDIAAVGNNRTQADLNRIAQNQATIQTLSGQRDGYLNQLQQFTNQGFKGGSGTPPPDLSSYSVPPGYDASQYPANN